MLPVAPEFGSPAPAFAAANPINQVSKSKKARPSLAVTSPKGILEKLGRKKEQGAVPSQAARPEANLVMVKDGGYV